MPTARPSFRALTATLSAALVVLLAACGGGGDDEPKATKTSTGASVDLTAGDVTVEAAGNPGTLADADKAAIVDTLKQYVTATSINPLEGKSVGDLGPIFTAAASASLKGPDGAAATDEGLPKATAKVVAKAPPVALTALSDPSGAIDLVGATVYLYVDTKAAGGPIHVLRSGELVLRRDAGAWKIDSYKLTVNRTGTGVTAATATTTTTEKPQS
jgi:hypothetical protein